MADIEFEAIRTAKLRAKARLFAIPGVHAVGIGPKQVSGQPTQVPAIIVCVVEKKPLESLPADQVIPAEIEGFKTDVVEMPIPTESADDDVDNVEDVDRERPVTGGTQVQAAMAEVVGTLGFLAIRQDSPNGEVVAVTNWHIVAAPARGTETNLDSTLTDAANGNVRLTFIKTGDATKPIKVGSVAYFGLTESPTVPTGYDFYVQTEVNDTPTSIAVKMRDEINSLGAPGIQATTVSNAVIEVTRGSTQNSLARNFGPTPLDPNCELKATTRKGTSGSLPAVTIKLTGRVPTGDALKNYGMFVNVNYSSSEHATQGFFLSISKGQALEEIASRLAQAFLDMNPLFTATASGREVTLAPATQVDVFVWRDIRVGQAWDNLATGCCDLCPDEMGPTIAADRGLDAALILVDSNRVSTYLAEVKDLGYIVGSHDVTLAEVMAGYNVIKRGRTTGKRNGRITMIEVDGVIGLTVFIPNAPANAPKPKYSPRKYDGAMQIVSTVSGRDFSGGGDSGSAILHHVSGDAYEVVGLLFGAGGNVATPITFAMPIKPILDRFSIVPSVATGLGQEKTVPERQLGTRQAVRPRGVEVAMPVSEIKKRIASFQAQISVSSSGRAHMRAVTQHVREINALVNRNRRVGVAWQRNGGPMIVNRVLEALGDPECPLPREILGEPWQDRLVKVAAALGPHASAGLRRELDGDTWKLLLALGGKTTRDIHELLRNADSTLESASFRSIASHAFPTSPPAAE